MSYEDILLAERKGVWRRLAGRVLERDLTRDLASAAQAAQEQSISDAAEIEKADKDARQDLEERKKQQEHAAKMQELLQQADWIAARDHAFAMGGDKALKLIVMQQEMRAKRQIARAEDLANLLNRANRPERSYDRGR